jgi:hypothetical protein
LPTITFRNPEEKDFATWYGYYHFFYTIGNKTANSLSLLSNQEENSVENPKEYMAN